MEILRSSSSAIVNPSFNYSNKELSVLSGKTEIRPDSFKFSNHKNKKLFVFIFWGVFVFF